MHGNAAVANASSKKKLLRYAKTQASKCGQLSINVFGYAPEKMLFSHGL